MKTSLAETKEIEGFLSKSLNEEDLVLFHAKLILRPGLVEEVRWQERAVELVKLYGRRKLKAELCELDKKLFTAPEHRSFSSRIARFFNY